MDIVDRIFDLVDQKYKEQKDFAADIGVDPARISEWRNRKSKSYRSRLDTIAAVLGTTSDYLLNGSRPDPLALPPEDAEILRQIHDRPGMRVMFSLTSKATDEDVRKAAEIIQAFLGKPED